VSRTSSIKTLSKWMLDNGFATGHGDSIEALLNELRWQVNELREKTQAAKAIPQTDSPHQQSPPDTTDAIL
jgi:hypothetical protein